MVNFRSGRGILAVVAVALPLAVALVGCASSALPSPSSPAAPSRPSLAAPSPSSPEAATSSMPATPAPTGPPREHRTTEFQPAFNVELPAGWTVAERGADVVQIYQECGTCAHGGEENGEITFDMTLADKSVDEAVADLIEADNIQADTAGPVKVGTLSGKRFTATRTGPVQFRPSGYGSDPVGLPIDVYVLTVAGKTATVFVDPHEATGEAGEGFMGVALQILESVRISSR